MSQTKIKQYTKTQTIIFNEFFISCEIALTFQSRN